SVLVVVLFVHRSDYAPWADAVTSADQRLLPAVLVEERRGERLGVLRSEVEDVPDLDRGLEGQCATAVRAAIAFPRLAEVGEARLVVAAGLDAAEMEAVPVRAGDELTLAQGLVGDHLALEADRPERSAAGAEGGADLVAGRRPGADLERGQQLRLAEAVVAADEREHDAAVVRRHGHRFRGRREV